MLDSVRLLPILTVSDGSGFAQTSGMIELFVEGGHMRFAVNVDSVERSGLHLSSRLLGLAKIVGSAHAQPPQRLGPAAVRRAGADDERADHQHLHGGRGMCGL